MKKLFVGNLAWEITEDTLRPVFEAYGAVSKINVVVDQYTGRSRGFGFVEMESADGATQAIAGLNDKPLMGRNMRVSLAQERTGERSGGGERGGDRGGDRGGGRNGNFGNRPPRGGGDREQRGGGGGGGYRQQSYRPRGESYDE
jgi:RNA recognition motif-containing protein